MIMLEWVIDYWLFGKDKDIIIIQLVMQLMEMLMSFKILIIQLILKVFGHTSIIHTVKLNQELLVSSNMDLKIQSKQSDMMLLIQIQNMSDLF